MEFIPIAGGALAFVGLVMMAVAAVMLARGNKRQVKVVIPTSTAAKMPPAGAGSNAPPPAPPKPEPPRPAPPKPAPPTPEPPKAEVPKAPTPPPAPKPERPKPPVVPPAPKPAPPVPAAEAPAPDPSVSEEGTRIAMIPPPEPVAPPPPPPAPEEPTVAVPIPKAPEPAEEEPQSTIAISPGDMSDFRTVVEQAAPKSHGVLVGLSGGMEGRKVTIDEEGFVIGRDQRTAQLVISDPRISKRHVWIGVRDGEVWAIDVGSTNGTYLNVPKSDRITETKLTPGDTLILAEDAARFEYRKE